MADEPISALTLFTSYSPADEVEILDVSDTTFASTGTNKRIQFASLLRLAGVPAASSAASGLTGLLKASSGYLSLATIDSVSADDYGAAGNGTTDDTAAINAAIATGLNVRFTPGKTYLTWGNHWLGTGQSLYGNGATLKLANQVSQACSATVNSGSTTLTVTSATGLKVGQAIVVANAAPGTAVAGTNYDQTYRVISADQRHDDHDFNGMGCDDRKRYCLHGRNDDLHH